MKSIDVVENKRQEDENDDEGQGCGHGQIADLQLPNANFVSVPGSPLKNRQLAIGNKLSVFDDYALNNICHVLATIHRGFKLLVNFFPFQNSQRVWRIVK